MAGRALAHVAALVAALGLTLSAPARAAGYRNEGYRFSATIPAELTFCRPGPFESDHGFSVELQRRDCAPHDTEHDWIGFFGNYNVAYEARSTRDLALAECGGAAVMRHVATLAGVARDSCDTVLDDGTREFRYIALRPEKGVWNAQWVGMGVSIVYRDPRRLPAYRAIAQRVMRSFVFW